jgi:hypothetical protein
MDLLLQNSRPWALNLNLVLGGVFHELDRKTN